MSNFPPNPYNNVPGAPPISAYPSQQMNHNQPPVNQPVYAGLKPDANSNSPLHAQSPLQQSNPTLGQIPNLNHFSQSSNSSPAFNRPGAMHGPPVGLPPSMLPPKPLLTSSAPQFPQSAPLATSSPRPLSNANSPSLYPPNFVPPSKQMNENAPPLIPSSQAFHQPLLNGPPMSGTSTMLPPPSSNLSEFTSSTRTFSPPGVILSNSAANMISTASNLAFGASQSGMSKVSGAQAQPNVPFTGAPLSGMQRNSPVVSGQPGPARGSPMPIGVNGAKKNEILPSSGTTTGTYSTFLNSGTPISMGTVSNGPQGPASQSSAFTRPMAPPITNISVTNIGTQNSQNFLQNGPQPGPMPGLQSGPRPPTGTLSFPLMGSANLPPSGLQSGPTMRPNMLLASSQSGHVGLPPSGPLFGPSSGPSLEPGPSLGPPSGPLGPPGAFQYAQGMQSGPGLQSGPTGLQSGPIGLQTGPMGLQSCPSGLQTGPTGPQNLPPMINASHGPVGPNQPVSNIQNRYPPMQQTNYNHTSMPQPSQFPQQTQGLTQQMGKMSVTQQGFDQLWGHQDVDLMQTRNILPEYPEDPPEIRLPNQFADAPNCSPEIFRCTINRIPETNSLLQKSRLPLGILIHPFKDLNHLPVIQCASIVRCRACRTYINPFVYFLDSKRWKCNLCFRVNDLPEEFQYDPVSKSYGDPTRRPEIKSATIEFIAPGEYMLRPPQPAVYLFLMDVSQLARDSNYLEVLCESLKSSLDQLPGDARTQVGFICFDTQIHYYLLSDGLTRPKEMTVIDVDDVFLPSPESLLVNLAERRDLINELLTVLPKRYSGVGAPGSALGAALQAALKLMSPTGGRITVFQTCLPSVGPGALQPREDPNARSSKDVAHLNPATDFYKRLALDCSGAQVSVDLFLLNSQYSDLATLSGMSKFSAGTVYHIPLFNASRSWQADLFRRMLNRYLTRKIGFEAVMRVRCTRGIAIHTFHGNFFVRSTDLLSLPNCSPDAGFGMQLTIEESLTDLQQVCFQAALLYTSSKGERRIRVHTLALPIANTLPDVLYSADQQCIIGLLSKMAVDRSASASLSEAREALSHVAVDVATAHRLARGVTTSVPGLPTPRCLRLLPLYLRALLSTKAFRTGTSTRLDDRVADMCFMKCAPLSALLRRVYPALYPIHGPLGTDPPPCLQLSAERINSTGAYLLDDGETMIIYVCHGVSPAYLSDTFGVTAFSQLPDEARTLPEIESEGNQALHCFIEQLNDDRPYPSNILLLRDNSPSRQQFLDRLIEDRGESSFSYYELLQHVKAQVK